MTAAPFEGKAVGGLFELGAGVRGRGGSFTPTTDWGVVLAVGPTTLGDGAARAPATGAGFDVNFLYVMNPVAIADAMATTPIDTYTATRFHGR